MKDVQRHLSQRALELEQHPLFTEWLDEPTRPPERKLVFAPMMLDLSMGSRDLCRYFLATGASGDSLAGALDAHAAAGALDARLFLDDWMTLGLDVKLGWSASDLYWWMSSEHTVSSRRADLELTQLVWQHPDARLRLAVVDAMDACWQVFSRHTAPVAEALRPRLARPLRLLGRPAAREDAPLRRAGEHALAADPLDPAMHDRAIALVDAVVTLFERHFAGWLELARAIEQRSWSMHAAVEGYRAGLVTRSSLPDDVARVLRDEARPSIGATVDTSTTRASPSTESLRAHRRGLVARLDAEEPLYGWLRRAPFVAAARLTALQWTVEGWTMADWFRMDATYETASTPLERGLNRVSELMASERRRQHAEWQLLDLDNVTGWEPSEAMHHHWLDPLVEEMRAAFADLRRLTFEHPVPERRYWVLQGVARLDDLVVAAVGSSLVGSPFGARQFPRYAGQGGLLHPELSADPEADDAVAALEQRAWTDDEQAVVRGIHARLAAQEQRRARASWEAIRLAGLAR